MLTVTLFDATSPHWGSELERIGVTLNAGRNPTLFPYHFLYVTLPKIGGGLARFHDGGRELGIGFLFPRLEIEPDVPTPVSPLPPSSAQPSAAYPLFPDAAHPLSPGRAYTLRYHSLLSPEAPVAGPALAAACAAALAAADGSPERSRGLRAGRAEGNLPPKVIFYDPHATQTYAATHELIGPVDIGRPDAAEAHALRRLQQEVWGSPPEFLYPADVHSREFAAGTSLVARVADDAAGPDAAAGADGADGTLAGFLFGFYKFGGSPLPAAWTLHAAAGLRLESQTMAVAPAYRGLRIAAQLKRAQARLARQAGIGIINWTADPLQFPNAALNCGLLRAVSVEFAPDLYPFRNELNRVHASRLILTWLVDSARVQEAPNVQERAEVVDLARRPAIPRANDGIRVYTLTLDAPVIAVEVPADWTGIQQNDVALAQAWRGVTDELLGHYLGTDDGRYAITGVGRDGERCYLLAERAGIALWARLGA